MYKRLAPPPKSGRGRKMSIKSLSMSFVPVLFIIFHYQFILHTSAEDSAMANSTKTDRLFVGTYTVKWPHAPNANGEGIYIYDLNSSADNSISFKKIDTIRDIISPTFLGITHNGKYLYAVSESESENETEIHAFQITGNDGDANYRLIGLWPIGSIGSCHVNIDKRDDFVFVSNYFGGSAAAFKIDKGTGRLEKKNFHQFTEFSNVNKERQEKPHLHNSVVDSELRYVYYADLGNDCIWRMNYSNSTGFDVQSMKKFLAPPGSGPRHMVFDPRNYSRLYVSCELTSYLLVYQVDANGDLRQMQYESTTSNVSNQGKGGVGDIHISDDGRFVYISTRFLDIMTVFRVDDNNGTVSRIQEIDCGGKIPRNFVLYSPSGSDSHYALVANQDTSDVAVFRRDTENGTLTRIQKVEVNTPVCLQILK